jgi:hypothetical protein
MPRSERHLTAFIFADAAALRPAMMASSFTWESPRLGGLPAMPEAKISHQAVVVL